MEAVSSSENRVVLASNDARAVVSRNYEGQEKTWLLTAFEKDRPEVDFIRSDLALKDQTRQSSDQPATRNIDVQSRLAKLADETDRAASLAIAARRDAKASGVLKSGGDLALAARQSGGALPMERSRPDAGVEGGSKATQSKGATAGAVSPEGPSPEQSVAIKSLQQQSAMLPLPLSMPYAAMA